MLCHSETCVSFVCNQTEQSLHLPHHYSGNKESLHNNTIREYRQFLELRGMQTTNSQVLLLNKQQMLLIFVSVCPQNCSVISIFITLTSPRHHEYSDSSIARCVFVTWVSGFFSTVAMPVQVVALKDVHNEIHCIPPTPSSFPHSPTFQSLQFYLMTNA